MQKRSKRGEKMILQGIRNFLKGLKYVFVPMGVLFFGLVLGLGGTGGASSVRSGVAFGSVSSARAEGTPLPQRGNGKELL